MPHVNPNRGDIHKMENKKDPREWTLMFFFASDNNLSPSMLYQLKSIKTAGYQLDTNVLVHFDPHERGIPSIIFDVNKMEKKGQSTSKIGDDTNPTVRDLAGDQIKDKNICSSSSDLDNLPAEEALTQFLDFSREHYPAKHYMLFLVGHGMVVGGDAFLPDDNPNSGISLVELGKILRNFSRDIDEEGVLELVGLHSCSMSAVEVLYQLKGTAKYMIGSEGLSFVGAWPYRQMLQKIFWTVKKAKESKANVHVPSLMKTLHELCLHNGADFIFAGYSSDLCLCSLDPKRVEALSRPIEKLTQALQAGLNDDRGKELILLAHWKSQSYFQELYTDLYDFCLILKDSCSESADQTQKAIKLACQSVIEVLTPQSDKQSIGPIVQADFVGPDCQYSNGLSIYFPWSRPVEDAREHFIRNYQTYAFVTELYGASWLQFLDDYFKKTMRPKRDIVIDKRYQEEHEFAKSMFRPFAFRSGQTQYPVSALTGKDNPADAGGEFSYSFIKNYSRDFAITERALKVFTNEKGRKKKTNQK
jgi:Clostripain family